MTKDEQIREIEKEWAQALNFFRTRRWRGPAQCRWKSAGGAACYR